TCSHDQTVRLWDVETGNLEHTIETGHTNIIYGLAVTPDGKQLVSGSWDQITKVWDLGSREEKLALRSKRYQPENNFPILSVACSPDNKVLALCGEEKTIKLIEAATGKLLYVLE